MNKLNMHTPNLADENFRKLAALFPNAVTETVNEDGEVVRAIDKDVLMQEISTKVVEGREERYQFTWPDKKKAVLAANAPISATLRPVRADSVGKDSTPGGWDSENLYIEGDNLDVLKLLRETYLGKVKMIYIDPPYNTGNDFVYEDDFAEDTDSYMARSGQYDEQGNQLVQNTDSNGRFHTDWLNMIYPRLRIAKDLLAEDGLVFISIDDCELTNARRICDEVFGACNFIDTIIWKKRYGGGAKEKWLVSLQEYVLLYCKNADILGELFVPLTNDNIERYYQKKDENYAKRGGYRTHPLEATKSMDERANLVYPIPAPDGSEIWPQRQWLWSKERAYAALANNELEIYKGNDGEWQVATKQYLRDADGIERQGKMFSIIEDIYTQHGTNEMLRLMGNAKIFPFPKPSTFIKQLLMVGTKKDSIILDFFSGSATTAHAVMQLNAEDGGHRKFIMVQLPEACDEKSEAYKAGYKNICEIGKERIRRAGRKIKESCEPQPLLRVYNVDLNSPDYGKKISEVDDDGKSCPDIGFRVLRLDSSNMQDVYYTPDATPQDLLSVTTDNIKPDRTPEDLLFQVMLELGVLPSSKIAEIEIAGKRVFDVADGFLLACFDAGATTETVTAIAKKKPYYAVFRDSSMANDSVATNFDQIFETYSPSTVRKVL